MVKLEELYGSKTTICSGKVHKYPRMDIDLRTKQGTIIVFIIKYLYKVIGKFREIKKGNKTLPCG